MTDIANLRINADRLLADFNELAEIGATHAGGVSRLALSVEDLEARAWFANRIEEAGLRLRDDDAGNLGGVLSCSRRGARTLLIGSHLDTVPNGGRYDGSVGVLAGLECMRVIKEAGIVLPFDLEVIDFTDEEGCWQSLFGSLGFTGKLTPAHINDAIDDHGPFRAALVRAGIRPLDALNARRPTNSLAGYLELHIEQGSRLDDEHIDIGVVTGIVGRTTYQFAFYGEAGHSGTTAREGRKDALQGAAAFILDAHEMVRERYPEGVFNCGNIEVHPGAFNIIPKEAVLTIECRHPIKETLTELEEALVELGRSCARQRGLNFNSVRVVHMPAAVMAPAMVETIEQAAQQLGATATPMVSYAGHDAQILSDHTPSGMIFIPSVHGISHNPKEYTEWDHVVLGANVLLQSVLLVALAQG